MNLYSPDRPEVTTNRKALLLDGSAVPRVSVFPIEDGRVELMVFLREHTSGENYSYSAHTILMLCSDLDKFFFNYSRDPELVLEHYFHWKAQLPTPRSTPSRAPEAVVKAQIQEYLDLI